MALTINTQPTSLGLYFANSPILIELISTQVAQTGFAYKLEVTLWHGGASTSDPVTYTLRKLPNPENSNRAVFDLSKLIQEKIQHRTSADLSVRRETINDGSVYCKITAYGTWDGGGSETATGNTWMNTLGYSYMSDQTINYKLGAGELLISRPSHTEVFGTFYLPIYLADYNRIIVSSGNNTLDFEFVQSASNSNKRIQYYDVYDVFQNFGNNQDYFDVQWSDGTTTSDTYRFYVGCESKYTAIPVQYLNRYGVFETLWLQKKHVRSRSYERVTFEKPHITDSLSIDMSKTGTSTLNVFSKISHVMNTGFLDEAENKMIEELMVSTYVAIYLDDQWKQVVVNDMELQEKTSLNDRLIQYTISFTEGHRDINTAR